MATREETEQALLDAIDRVATGVDPQKMNGAYLEATSAATARLAEAYAWLRSPGQSH